MLLETLERSNSAEDCQTLPVLAIVEDDGATAEILSEQAKQFGFKPEVMSTGGAAVEFLDGGKGHRWDAVLLDLGLPDMDGRDLLGVFKRRYPDMPCLVLTASDNADDAVAALRSGAEDFIVKPQPPDGLFRRVWAAINRSVDSVFVQTDVHPPDHHPRFSWLSESMIPIRDVFRRAAATMSPVLIEGERGVGKMEYALRLQKARGADGSELVEMDCGSVRPRDFEARLFGSVPGFPGGLSGLLSGCSRPTTLILREIKDLPLPCQVWLAEWLGAGKGTGACRIIATSSLLLDRLVIEPGVCPEMAYRLSELVISIPPLRRRRKDLVKAWSDVLCSRFTRRGGIPPVIPDDIRETIERHGWRGNLYELIFTADEVARSLKGSVVKPADLKKASKLWAEQEAGILGEARARGIPELERSRLLEALSSCGGNRRKAAEWLGVSLRSIYNLIERHGLK